jgi:hypothetical protein
MASACCAASGASENFDCNLQLNPTSTAARRGRASGFLRRKTMPDDKTRSTGQDRKRINVHEDYELRDWAKSLKTTPQRVKEAVAAVGDRAEKVREWLREKGG